jgi:hypothetical protein
MFYAYSGAQPFVLIWAAGLAVVYRGSIARRPLCVRLGS